MDFFDPAGGPLVTPHVMVKNLTRRRIGTRSLRVQPCALIVVLPHDLRDMTKRLRGESMKGWQGYREVYRGYVDERMVTVALSPVGAPNIVALAEELAAFGMKKAIFLGYCGSLQQEVKVGDIIVPAEAIREEGASFHYLPPDVPALPSQDIQAAIVDVLQRNKAPYHEGKIWTTDAIYRETEGKVKRYHEEGVLGVEMEISALFAVGMAQGIEVGGVLVVSDELLGGRWRPRFFSPQIIRGVTRARKMVVEILRAMA